MIIPNIDFADYDDDQAHVQEQLASEIFQALTEVGFMSVKNLGVSQELRQRMFAASQAFFALPTIEKQRLNYSGATSNFGYQSFGQEHLAPSGPADMKEALTIPNPLSRQDADWPDTELRDVIMEFYQTAMVGARNMQRVFARILGTEANFFVDRHSGENITLRLLHYPTAQARSAEQLGAGAHTDYGMMTLLFQDMTGGLEVEDSDGRWQPVTPVEDHIVINTGDLMERWTNNTFRSTRHRVLPRHNQQARYAIALFIDPDTDVKVDCLPSCISATNPARYKTITAGEHIQEKIKATHH